MLTVSPKIILAVLLAIFPTFLEINAFDKGLAKITFKVLNSKNKPISDACVEGGFFNIGKSKNDRSGDFEGYTDANGYFSKQAETTGEVRYWANKDGYYETDKTFRWLGYPKAKIINGRWEPWNPTLKVVLKKIINPIPMYVKSVEAVFPEENKSFGFDLKKGDYVAPYGKGANTDLFFKVSRDWIDSQNFTVKLVVTFSKPGDGIQTIRITPYRTGSKLKSPHKAPLTGYENTYIYEFGRKNNLFVNIVEGRNTTGYIFRVNTVLDKDGKVKSAEYGKIYGRLRVAGYGTSKMTLIFRYYFNPKGTRNIEFDPKKNLFKSNNTYEP